MTYVHGSIAFRAGYGVSGRGERDTMHPREASFCSPRCHNYRRRPDLGISRAAGVTPVSMSCVGLMCEAPSLAFSRAALQRRAARLLSSKRRSGLDKIQDPY